MIEIPPSGVAVAEKSMELEIDNSVKPFHVFARLLAGDTKTLLFDTPLVCALAVKERIFEFTKLPISEQRLICAGRQLDDASLIPAPDSTVHLCLRLRGGKGGFGSLLRGAATKAGQKKTNNFDACRDMSGRRLRHVNAEKKLEEWTAEEEERRLEKIAEDFIKKAAKKGKKGAGEGEAQKYVEKYREESAKCVAQVELSVREAIGCYTRRAKRKYGEEAGLHGKKLKIWMGKRKMADSDNDDMDENSSEGEDDGANEKSVILDNANGSDSVNDVERSSDSSTGERQECIRAAGSTESGSEEEKGTISQEISVSGGCSSNESLSNQRNSMAKSVSHVDGEDQGSTFPPSEAAAASNDSADRAGKEELDKLKHGNNEVATSRTPSDLLNSGEERVIAIDVPHVSNGVLETKVTAMDDTMSLKADKGEEKPLNFEKYNSAAELEVLGLERLKTELKMRGLKCGGTLQERASRLYLLKSMTLDKIPKRHLAKK